MSISFLPGRLKMLLKLDATRLDLFSSVRSRLRSLLWRSPARIDNMAQSSSTTPVDAKYVRDTTIPVDSPSPVPSTPPPAAAPVAPPPVRLARAVPVQCGDVGHTLWVTPRLPTSCPFGAMLGSLDAVYAIYNELDRTACRPERIDMDDVFERYHDVYDLVDRHHQCAHAFKCPEHTTCELQVDVLSACHALITVRGKQLDDLLRGRSFFLRAMGQVPQVDGDGELRSSVTRSGRRYH